jgi:hypothetical protein
MAKIDEQLATIQSMVQQLLKNSEADKAEDMGESEDRCPYCGCNGDHEDSPVMGHGKTIIMMSKKKLKPGQMPEMPSVLKDILGAMTKKT